MKQLFLVVAVVVAALVCSGPMASADQLLAEFSEQTVPTNPMNGFSSFTFDDFSAEGAVTDGPDSLTFDVVDADGANGVFGGTGVDYGTFNEILMLLEPIDFDPEISYWQVRLKKLPNNGATAVRTTIRDMDIPGTSGDEHVFEFDLTAVPDDGEFHTLMKPFTDVLFTQGAFGFQPGDGINNPGMDQMQIQSIFDSTGRLNFELDFAQIWQVPEPTSLALLGLGSLFLIAGRRGKTN